MPYSKKIKQRLNLCRALFSSQREFPVAWPEVVRSVCKWPCTFIGPKYIEGIEDGGEYYLVKIRSIATKLFWPKSLPLFDLYKVVTECFYEDDSHYYEIPETRVAPNDVVLDCGAAEGIFALRVLERAGRIVAFEPLPLFITSMQKTFAPHAAKVAIQPFALADVTGNSFLSGTSVYGSVVDIAGKDDVPIQVTTIDKWAEESNLKVDFIKGDLESFEYRVLQGAAETIRQNKPKIALTVYHPGNDWQEILHFCLKIVPEYSYKIKGISYNQNKLRPVMIHLWAR